MDKASHARPSRASPPTAGIFPACLRGGRYRLGRSGMGASWLPRGCPGCRISRDTVGARCCPGPWGACRTTSPTPAHAQGRARERFLPVWRSPVNVPASYNGLFEQGQLTARWQRCWKYKFAAGEKANSFPGAVGEGLPISKTKLPFLCKADSCLGAGGRTGCRFQLQILRD